MDVRDGEWTSADGLTLCYRDWGPDHAVAPPVLCLPGLTRNSRDFEPLARRHAASRRVLTPDVRGRGRSDWDPQPANYHVATYVADVWALLDELAIAEVVVVGTSLGGLMAMLMAAERPQRIAGVVLNDIGPEIGEAGLARIRRFVGRLPRVHTWAEAAWQCRTVYRHALPDYDDERWLAFARLSYEEDEEGRPVPMVDPAIGDALRAAPATPPPDWWACFDAMHMPVLAIRGALSDILLPDTLARMRERKPQLEAVVVPGRGHPPMLDEPEAVAALDAFLARVSARG